MAKIVSETHITGAKGVNAFERYCLNHTPLLVWREETKNDYGIDGEVEFTYRTNDNKLAVSGKIIKVQLKSTDKKGYIQKETVTSFEFIAKQDDVEYWSDHDCDVVLVVYFVNEEKLFARKISKKDLNLARKTQPILFSKIENELVIGDNLFEQKFSSYFKSRVDSSHEEKLFSNLYRFFRLPKFIYCYQSRFTNPKDIFTAMENYSIPPFVIKNGKLFFFAELISFPEFEERVILDKDANTEHFLKSFMKDDNNRRIIAQLINIYIKDYCYQKYIGYNRRYNRYYFKLADNQDKRTEQYRSKKDRSTNRVVAQRQDYYGVKHVRHLGFQLDYVYSDEEYYVAINPKYLFTSDGHKVLEEPRLITKLTNYQTARELNQSVINQIHFIFKFLANNGQALYIADFPKEKIQVYQSKTFSVDFGIRDDYDGDPNQMTLL